MNMGLKRQPASEPETLNDQKYNVPTSKLPAWMQTPNGSSSGGLLTPKTPKKSSVAGLSRVLGRGKVTNNLVHGSSSRNLLDDQSVASNSYHNELLTGLDSIEVNLILPGLGVIATQGMNPSKATKRRSNFESFKDISGNFPDSSIEAAVEYESKSDPPENDEGDKSSNPTVVAKGKETYDTIAKEKPTKLEKIHELLVANKELKKVVQGHQRELFEKDKRLRELEKAQSRTGQRSGEEPTNNEKQVEALQALSSVSQKQHDSLLLAEIENKRMQKEIDRNQKESKQLKKELAAKKKESIGLEKEINANLTEILGLRKELSQTLQQLDNLEEEQDEDRSNIFFLTKEISQLRSGNPSEPADVIAMKEQLELSERNLKKKDRLIENQRKEVENKVGQIMQLKTELEQAEKKLEKSQDECERLKELSQDNPNVQNQLEDLNLLKLELEEVEAKLQHSQEQCNLLNNLARANAARQDQLKGSKIAFEESEEMNHAIKNEEAMNHLQVYKDRNLISSGKQELCDIESTAVDYDQLERDIELLQTALNEANYKNRELMEKNELLEGENLALVALRHAFKNAEEGKEEAEEKARKVVSELNTDVIKLQMSLSQSTEKCARLETEIGDLREELNRLHAGQEKWQRSTETAESHTQLFSEPVAEIQSAHREIFVFQVEIEDLRSKNSELEEQLNAVIDDRNDWRKAAEMAEMRADDLLPLVATIQNSKAEVILLREEVDELRNEKENLEEQARELSEERDAWKASAEDAGLGDAKSQAKASLVEEVQKELATLQSQSINRCQSNHDADRYIEELTSERDNWREAAEQAQLDLEDAREELNNILPLYADAEELRRAMRQQEAESDESKKVIEHWRAVSETMQTQLVEAKSSLVRLEQQRSTETTTTKLELAETRTAISSLKVLLEGYETDLLDMKVKISELESELQDASRQRDEWKDIANVNDLGVSEGNRMFEMLQLECSELRAEVDTLREQNADFENEIKVIVFERVELQQKLDGTVTELLGSKSALEIIEKELYQIVQESSELRLLIENLETQLSNVTTERDIFEENHKRAIADVLTVTFTAQARNSEHQESISRTQQSLEELLTQKADLEGDLEVVVKERDGWKELAETAETDANEAHDLIASLEEKFNEFSVVENEVVELRQDRITLCSEIDDLRDERDALKASLARTQSNLSENEQQLNSKLSSLDDDLHLQTKKIKSLELIVGELREQTSGDASVIMALEIMLEKIQAENVEYKAQITVQEESISEKSNVKSAVAELEEQISNNAIVIKGLRSMQDDFKSTIEELQNDNTEYRAQIESMNRSIELAQSTFSENEKLLAAQLSCLEVDILTEKTKAVILQNSIEELEGQRETLTNTELEMRKELSSFKEEGEELRRQISMGTSAIATLDSRNNELEAMTVKLKNENNEYKTRIEELTAFLQIARSNLSENEKKLSDQLSALASELQAEKNKAQVMQSHVEELESQCEVLQSVEQEWRDEISTLNVEVAELRDQISCDATLISDLQTSKEYLQTSINALRIENTECMGHIEASKSNEYKIMLELSALRQEVTELHSQISDDAALISDFRSKQDDFESLVAKLQNENIECKVEIDELKGSLETAHSNLSQNERTLSTQVNNLESALQTERNNVSVLQKHNDELEADIVILRIAEQGSRGEILTLKGEVTKLHEKIISETTFISHLKAQNEITETMLEERQTEVSELEVQLEKQRSETNEWKSKVDTSAVAALSTSAFLANTKEELAQSLARINALQKEVNHISKERDDWKHQSISESESAAKSVALLEDLEQAFKEECSQSFLVQVGELDQTIADLAAQIEELEKENEDLRHRNEGCISQIQIFARDLDEKNSDLDSPKAEFQAPSVHLKSAIAVELNLIKKEVISLRHRNGTYASQVEKLTKERDEWMISSRLSKEAVMQLENTQKGMEDQLAERERLEHVNAELFETITRVSTELEALKTAPSDDLLRALEELDKENEELSREADYLRKRNAELETSLERFSVEKSMPNQSLSDISSEKFQNGLDSLKQENIELRIEVNELLSERDDWRTLADVEIVSIQAILEKQKEELIKDVDADFVNCLKTWNSELQKQIEKMAKQRCEIKSSSGHSSPETFPIAYTTRSCPTSQEEHVRVAAETKKSTATSRWNFLSSNDKERGVELDYRADATNLMSQKEIEDYCKEIKDLKESIRRLTSENLKIVSTMKDEMYVSKKKVETLESENSAYLLKIQMLEFDRQNMISKLADIEAASALKLNKIYFGTGKKTIKELEDALVILERQKKFAQSECEAMQNDFDNMATASNLATDRFTKEIEHMKKIQGDYDDKISALEKMVLAVNQENASLREMAAQRADVVSAGGYTAANFAQDEKDVKIAQLHYELVNLRMRLDTIRHEDLKQEVIQLEKEKLQLKGIWQEKLEKTILDHEDIVESLQFRLRSREETIALLEESLDLQLQKTAMAS